MEGEVFDCPSCGIVVLEVGDWPYDCRGSGHGRSTYASTPHSIHFSERSVVYTHPSDNKREFPDITPGRNDLPMNPKYSARGYERTELSDHNQVANYEKTSGKIVERRHYNKNSAAAEKAVGGE